MYRLMIVVCAASMVAAGTPKKTRKPKRIAGITWHASLESAREAAQPTARRKARPIALAIPRLVASLPLKEVTVRSWQDGVDTRLWRYWPPVSCPMP